MGLKETAKLRKQMTKVIPMNPPEEENVGRKPHLRVSSGCCPMCSPDGDLPVPHSSSTGSILKAEICTGNQYGYQIDLQSSWTDKNREGRV